jgi:hypothetical protein
MLKGPEVDLQPKEFSSNQGLGDTERALNGEGAEEGDDKKPKRCRCVEGRSLFLFKKDNKFRHILLVVVEHKYFEDFIYHLIAMNSVLLLINYPLITDPYFN